MSKRRKKHRPPQGFTPTVESRSNAIQSLDLGFLDAAPIQLPDFQMCQIIVVGAGGIGAYMVQHVGRIMRVMYQSDRGVHLTVVDPDVVEDVNIGRQLFCDAEVGIPKAEAIARRYGQAWGLNCSSFVGEFDESLILGAELTILVGCVDNAAARRALHTALESNEDHEIPTTWWLDCGNLIDTGRVLLGTAADANDMAGAFSDPKHCTRLPSPGVQSPGLLETRPDEAPDGTMSCAEMAAANLQSLTINSRIASEASDFLARLLVTKDLKRFAWEVNLAAGSARSSYTTPEAVARAAHRSVEFLKQPMSARPQTVSMDRIEAAMQEMMGL